MKIKYINRKNWHRIEESSNKVAYINNNKYSGYVSYVYIKKVRSPLKININGKIECLLDKDYKLIHLLPDDDNYCLTATLVNDTIQYLYFDIIDSKGKDSDNDIFFKDLYLDISISQGGNPKILDEDELKDALDRKEITLESYIKAYEEVNKILKKLNVEKYYYKDLCQLAYRYLREDV